MTDVKKSRFANDTLTNVAAFSALSGISNALVTRIVKHPQSLLGPVQRGWSKLDRSFLVSGRTSQANVT